MDSVFLEADEALKGAERRPTAQKGGSARPPKSHLFSAYWSELPTNDLFIL